jgi:hypothetical protein
MIPQRKKDGAPQTRLQLREEICLTMEGTVRR